MRWLCGVALLALAIGPAQARMMLDESPLKPLCDQLCGGVWQEEDPSDQMGEVQYRFRWDEEAGLLYGEAISARGENAEDRRKILLLFGANVNNTLWSMRVDREGPPVYGPLLLEPKGYLARVSPIGVTDEYMISTVRFTDEDSFTMVDEINGKGVSVRGNERRFEREPE